MVGGRGGVHGSRPGRAASCHGPEPLSMSTVAGPAARGRQRRPERRHRRRPRVPDRRGLRVAGAADQPGQLRDGPVRRPPRGLHLRGQGRRRRRARRGQLQVDERGRHPERGTTATTPIPTTYSLARRRSATARITPAAPRRHRAPAPSGDDPIVLLGPRRGSGVRPESARPGRSSAPAWTRRATRGARARARRFPSAGPPTQHTRATAPTGGVTPAA